MPASCVCEGRDPTSEALKTIIIIIIVIIVIVIVIFVMIIIVIVILLLLLLLLLPTFSKEIDGKPLHEHRWRG